MGKGSCDPANSDSKEHGLGSREAHDVSSSPKEDRGIPAGISNAPVFCLHINLHKPQ